MRSFAALDGAPGQRSFTGIVSGDASVAAASSPAAHADYRIERRIDDLAFGATKSTRVAVRWRDRGGNEREVLLHSLIAGIAPAYAGLARARDRRDPERATRRLRARTRLAADRTKTRRRSQRLEAERARTDRAGVRRPQRRHRRPLRRRRRDACDARPLGRGALGLRDRPLAARRRDDPLRVDGCARSGRRAASRRCRPRSPSRFATATTRRRPPASAKRERPCATSSTAAFASTMSPPTRPPRPPGSPPGTRPAIASSPGIASSRRAPTAAGRAGSRCVGDGWTIGAGSNERRVCRYLPASAQRDRCEHRGCWRRRRRRRRAARAQFPGRRRQRALSERTAHRAVPALSETSHENEPMTATPSNDAAAPMREALALAAHAVGLSDPNPRVGCVIVGADGRLAGRGHTQEAGGAHAEAMALRDAAARGVDVRGATVYVTLEPCSHHGRTPPCADALVAAGVARVVIALRDPNPLVSGRGAARLARRRHRRRMGRRRRGVARAQHRLRLAHGARPALAAPEGRGLARRAHRARRRHQPVDHRRGGARRRPRLAQARERGPDRRRHGARGRPSTRRSPGRDARASRCAWSSIRASRRRRARASSRRPDRCSSTPRSTTRSAGGARGSGRRGRAAARVRPARSTWRDARRPGPARRQRAPCRSRREAQRIAARRRPRRRAARLRRAAPGRQRPRPGRARADRAPRRGPRFRVHEHRARRRRPAPAVAAAAAVPERSRDRPHRAPRAAIHAPPDDASAADAWATPPRRAGEDNRRMFTGIVSGHRPHRRRPRRSAPTPRSARR